MKHTIVLTGASGKLGKVLTEYFLRTDNTVIAICRSKNSTELLVKSFSKYPKNLVAIHLDLMLEEAHSILLSELNERNLLPTCLVNNARNQDYLKLDNGNASRRNFTNELTLGVIAPYELTMALANQDNSKIQVVVNVGSIYGSVAANPNLYLNPTAESSIHYGVTKAALAHLTRELAVRLSQKKIRVNCIAYGGVEGRVDEQFAERYAALCPSGRMLKESEVTGPFDLLLSEAGSGINGHVLAVDGGWTIW